MKVATNGLPYKSLLMDQNGLRNKCIVETPRGERERERERERGERSNLREREMGGGAQAMKRIPRIKFPPRHPKSSSSGSAAQTQSPSTTGNTPQTSSSRSDVPAAPTNMAVGGQASLQPKRTPVSEKEIEAIMLGGCI